MDLKQLRHLVAIVETESFSRAAQMTAISQPALTRSIKLLEERLLVVLFERTTRRVTPTEAGLRLYKRAKVILNEAENALADLQDGERRTRRLRIGMAPMFATTILPKAIQAFRERAPNVEVIVESDLFEELAARLEQADLDLVVSNFPYGWMADDLESEPVVDIDVVYLASAAHPLAKKTKISVTDLLAYPWAVVDESHANELYGSILTSEGGKNSPIGVRTNSLNLLKTLVETPPWVTLLPLHMVQPELTREQLVALDVVGDQMRRRGGIVYRRARSDDVDLVSFAECVRDACQSRP